MQGSAKVIEILNEVLPPGVLNIVSGGDELGLLHLTKPVKAAALRTVVASALGARRAPGLAATGWNVFRVLIMVRRRPPDRPPERGAA